MDNELISKARDELKRVDHLIYVSLKYTRTVEVIRNVLERVISAFDLGLDALLENKNVDNIPNITKSKCDLIKRYYTDEKTKDYVDFYIFLRKLMRCKYTEKNEFRRHVTMVSDYDGVNAEANIDNLGEMYEKLVKSFIEHVTEMIKK